MTIVLLLAVGLVPHSATIDDTCNVVEVNHFYDAEGKKVFTQAIFWGWNERSATYRVIAWRLLKEPMPQALRNGRRGYQMIWYDDHALRRVRSSMLRTTWTQFDPELQDRKNFPSEKRRGLTKGD